MSAVRMPTAANTDAVRAPLEAMLQRQRQAFEAERFPSCTQRRRRLAALISLLQGAREPIIAALKEDFGHRSADETRIAEIAATVGNISYARRHLAGWMRPRRRGTSIWFLPGSNAVEPQPLGVVGVMVPWNYPINLAVSPLAAALAAGNRVMLKMSEYTPASAALLRRLLRREFDESEVAVYCGGADEAAAFASLRFDHLFFTGSTAVGRKVMAAAAEHLTPVTLELGGKSPVIVGPDYPIEEAALRTLWGKVFNAGQTCVAPDYVLLPEGRSQDFIIWMARHYLAQFPQGAQGEDYTSTIDARQFARLEALRDDAAAAGAEIIPLEPLHEGLRAQRKFPLTLVRNAPPEARLWREEIFGPLLPIQELPNLDSAYAFVNARPRPLALHMFSHSTRDRAQALQGTHAGGVSFNDVMLQYLQVAQPFGGVGASGMGRYHGREGFETFSHLKPVFRQRGPARFTGLKLLYPPYGPVARRLIGLMGG